MAPALELPGSGEFSALSPNTTPSPLSAKPLASASISSTHLVISAPPLAMGLLTENGPPVWHPASPDLKHSCHVMGSVMPCEVARSEIVLFDMDLIGHFGSGKFPVPRITDPDQIT
ncbi:hypothetical protein DKX38_014170 [Salix brachista]|uniref:Uncharacterized protein n=1 Tax=Salix brachista TaxID=2182728 RepID=A0A5N5LGV3_9ROSI|nr:hypothetical protein DKX38_014170 [Salix brachista]